MGRADAMGRVIPLEVEVDGRAVPMLAYLEATARSLPGAVARVLLTLECPWVVLALGAARYKSAAELLEQVRDPALRWPMNVTNQP